MKKLMTLFLSLTLLASCSPASLTWKSKAAGTTQNTGVVYSLSKVQGAMMTESNNLITGTSTTHIVSKVSIGGDAQKSTATSTSYKVTGGAYVGF